MLEDLKRDNKLTHRAIAKLWVVESEMDNVASHRVVVESVEVVSTKVE